MMWKQAMIAACTGGLVPAVAPGAAVVLNEYNAVSGSNLLDEGEGADSFFGTIEGNGGNWFELMVVDDSDLRGWQLNWSELGEEVAPGVPAAGSITLSNDAFWSEIKRGTILTFIESADADGVGSFDTSTDTSFDPLNGDWWMNFATREEQGKVGGLLTTTTNDGSAGDFSVGNDDWTLEILDGGGNTVFGPAGEGVYSDGGIGSDEGFALEGPLSATLADWQALTPTFGELDNSNGRYDDTGGTTFGELNGDLQDNGSFVTIQDASALRVIPEPTSLALLGVGGLALLRRRA